MSEQYKTSEILLLNQQIDELKEKINNANVEANKHKEKRDKLNDEFKRLRQEINQLKNERNNLNEEVKTLKQKRDSSREIIIANIEDLKMHKQEITELKKKAPKESRQKLQKEFEDIEWKIQTTPLDVKEEKKLIESVKQLETKLNIYKKISQHINVIDTLRIELETLRTNANSSHKELTEIAKRSQEIHAKVIAKINESKVIKEEADCFHGAYIQAKEKLKPLSEEVRRLTDRKRKLQDALQAEAEKRKKDAEDALKEKLESQAKSKLQRGEKLNWDEFKLLEEMDSDEV